MLSERYAKAKRYAERRGFGEIAEDFAGYCAEAWLSKKNQKQSLRYAFIDFLRKERGGQGPYAGSDALNKEYRQVIRKEDTLELLMGRTIAKSYKALDPIQIDFNKALESFSKLDRATLVLAIVYGLNQEEIAYCFGVTYSRISQQLKVLLKSLRDCL